MEDPMSTKRQRKSRPKPPPQVGNGLRLLRLSEVLGVTGLSKSGLYKLMAEDDFVKPVRISARAVGWVESEVSTWIAGRMAQRDQEAA
jgi:prophage regulatory protein